MGIPQCLCIRKLTVACRVPAKDSDQRWTLCAAVVAGIRRGLLDSPVEVETRGGELTIAWQGADNPVWMTGPAESVFEGEIETEEL